MPNLPYLVYGTVKLSGTDQLLEGATVKVTDTVLNESLSIATGSAGTYTLNLANFSGSWTVGDELIVIASIGNRSKTETTAISEESLQINFVLDITTYPNFNLDTEQLVVYSALDTMDCDKTFEYNPDKTISKVTEEYGKFTITRHYKYNSAKQVINENKLVIK